MRSLRFTVKMAASDLQQVAEAYRRHYGKDAIYNRLTHAVEDLHEIDKLMREGIQDGDDK